MDARQKRRERDLMRQINSTKKGCLNAIRPSLLLLAIVSTTILSGCGGFGNIVLHPIEKQDIQPMTKGVPYTPEVDGWFLSNLYMDEVVNAKVQRVKKDS